MWVHSHSIPFKSTSESPRVIRLILHSEISTICMIQLNEEKRLTSGNLSDSLPLKTIHWRLRVFRRIERKEFATCTQLADCFPTRANCKHRKSSAAWFESLFEGLFEGLLPRTCKICKVTKGTRNNKRSTRVSPSETLGEFASSSNLLLNNFRTTCFLKVSLLELPTWKLPRVAHSERGIHSEKDSYSFNCF